MQQIKCEVCKNKDARFFVHEHRTDTCICTLCGCVQRSVFTTGNSTFDSTVPQTRAVTSSDKRVTNNFNSLMVRAFPQEERKKKRERRIIDICKDLELPTPVSNHAIKMYNEFNEELCRIRPIDHMLIACVVVAARSTSRLFLPMSRFEREFSEIPNISELTKRICKIVGINQRAVILNFVPYVVSMLQLPFKYEEILKENYNKISRLAPSMCGETKLAVATCKTLKDKNEKIDIAYIAFLTESSEASIRNFMIKKR